MKQITVYRVLANLMTYDCDGCGGSNDPYMIQPHLWKKISASAYFLCLSCVQKRLGRNLKKSDFTDAAINFWIKN